MDQIYHLPFWDHMNFGLGVAFSRTCLQSAVRRRVHPVPAEAPRIAILFSGGIDSMMIAAMADRYAPCTGILLLIIVNCTASQWEKRKNGNYVNPRSMVKSFVDEIGPLAGFACSSGRCCDHCL
jgi:hypothetical protein